jgi:hypothetical protein
MDTNVIDFIDGDREGAEEVQGGALPLQGTL